MPALSHPELLKRLRRLSKALQEQCELINYGGCGIVAGIVGEHLQVLGVSVEVVTPTGGNWCEGLAPAQCRAKLDEWGLEPEKVSPFEWDEAGLWRNHLALRFESEGRLYTWDSEGLIRGGVHFGVLARNGRHKAYGHRADYEFGLGLTVAECKNMAFANSGWNRTFNRAQVPTIAALAAQFLSEV